MARILRHSSEIRTSVHTPYPPQLAVEFGRKALYSDIRPSFSELEALTGDIRGRIRTEE